MKMLTRTAVFLAAACLAAPLAFAQSYEPVAAADSAPASQAAFSDPELDQMLAPVALYPDELLSQVLMASTYPLEVVQAARWSRANPGLQGDDAVSAVDSMDWDPSVKSLVAFPDVLQQMDRNLDWTQRLGEAFLAQQDGVMASVQRLRGAAMQAGNLASTDEMVVSREGDGIALDSPSPDTMYVPYYDPRQVYGDWSYPAYPPVYWAPWPGYYWGGSAFAWTIGIPIGVDFFFGDFDWHRHHVRVYDHHPFYTHEHARDSRDHQWRWDPHHRRDVQFHNPIARQEFAHATTPRPARNSGGAPRTTDRGDRTPRTGERAPQPGNAIARPTQRVPQPASPIARPGTQQSHGNPLAAPPSQAQGQQGFFPQQRTQPRTEAQQPRHEGQGRARPQYSQPQIARPPAAPQLEQRQQYVPPQQQPLARPNVPQQGVHLMPQFQHPAQPAPQAPQIVRPMPQVVRPMPAQPITGPAPSHPAPAQGREPEHEGNESPRGGR